MKYFSLHRHTMLEKNDGSPIVIIQSNNEFEMPNNINLQYIKGHEHKMYFNVEHDDNINNGNNNNIMQIDESGVLVKTPSISNCVTWITEEKLNTHNLHLNHYTLQSEEFYFNVKIKRGDAVQDFHRREESFKLHEKSFNQVVDNELEQKTRGRRRWS